MGVEMVVVMCYCIVEVWLVGVVLVDKGLGVVLVVGG